MCVSCRQDSDSTEEKVWALIHRFEELKAAVGLPMSLKEAGVTWEEFESKLDMMAAMAFDDQCTGANPRYPLIAELKQLFIDAYHGPPTKLGMVMGNGYRVAMSAADAPRASATSAAAPGARELRASAVRGTPLLTARRAAPHALRAPMLRVRSSAPRMTATRAAQTKALSVVRL
jgi:hypothetical protein